MPHQCTTCGNVFPDGSTEMLSGCPECGGNAFQFYPEGTAIPDEPPDVDPPESEGMGGRVGRAASTVRNLMGGEAPVPSDGAGSPPSADADWPNDREDAAQAAARGSTGPVDSIHGGDIIVADESDEDGAQSAARADVATPPDTDGAQTPDQRSRTEASHGPPSPAANTFPMDSSGGAAPSTDSVADGPPTDGRIVSTPSGETPDLADLREQLNDQFESIKIVEPGEYELNLMELYEREEYIIALQENGRYVIQMPEQWMGDVED